jgi:plasmid stabilization system protein ParE
MEQLAEFSELGEVYRGAIRRLLHRPYYIYYRISGDLVTILALRHSARRPLRRF